MLKITRFVSVLMLMTAAVFAPAVAAEYTPYDQALFEQSQAQNKPILVFVHAPWCPVCKAQMKTIDEIVDNDAAYSDLKIYRIDYDTQPEVWRRFGVTMQSTLIAFHGAKERSRIAHISAPAAVADVMRQVLK